MGLSFNSDVEKIGLGLNIAMLFLSIVLYFFVDSYKSKRLIIIFTALWAIAILLFYYIQKNILERASETRGNMTHTKEKEKEIANNFSNHNELYFHLSLVSYYIHFIVAGIHLYSRFKK